MLSVKYKANLSIYASNHGKKKIDATFNVHCEPNSEDKNLSSEFLQTFVALLVKQKCEKIDCTSILVKCRTKSVGVVFVIIQFLN